MALIKWGISNALSGLSGLSGEGSGVTEENHLLLETGDNLLVETGLNNLSLE